MSTTFTVYAGENGLTAAGLLESLPQSENIMDIVDEDESEYYEEVFVTKRMDSDVETYFKVPVLDEIDLETSGESDFSEDDSNQLSPRIVFGYDDRKMVSDSDMSQSPYRKIMKLWATWPNGSKTEGTAWLFSASKAITAAHCLYDSKRGGWASEVKVSAGHMGNYSAFDKANPYGQQSVYGMTIDNSYISYESFTADYGVIDLSSDVGNTTGYFNFNVGSFPNGYQYTIAGYPLDNKYRLYKHKDTFTDADSDLLFYQIDTDYGQSGSPIYNNSDVVVAMHTNSAGEDSYMSANYGIKITSALKSLFLQSRNSDLYLN